MVDDSRIKTQNHKKEGCKWQYYTPLMCEKSFFGIVLEKKILNLGSEGIDAKCSSPSPLILRNIRFLPSSLSVSRSHQHANEFARALDFKEQAFSIEDFYML